MGKRMQHVGISVVSLERSIEFYRNGFGMEVVGQNDFSGEIYEAIMGLKGATGRVAMMKVEDVHVELFEFSSPQVVGGNPMRPVSDHGITHMCIEVDDIQEDYARLKLAGASFHCPPVDFYGIAIATYGRDPDGNVFELIMRSSQSPESETRAVN